MSVKSVDEEPEVTLTNWGLMQESFGGYRLVGLRDGVGRVTSPIVEFDEHSRTALTASGRRYHLSGPLDEDVAARLIRAHILPVGFDYSGRSDGRAVGSRTFLRREAGWTEGSKLIC